MTTFSPYATNILDAVGKNLQTKDGKAVTVRQDMSGNFMIDIEGKPQYVTGDNISASYYLNTNEVDFIAAVI